MCVFNINEHENVLLTTENGFIEYRLPKDDHHIIRGCVGEFYCWWTNIQAVMGVVCFLWGVGVVYSTNLDGYIPLSKHHIGI